MDVEQSQEGVITPIYQKGVLEGVVEQGCKSGMNRRGTALAMVVTVCQKINYLDQWSWAINFICLGLALEQSEMTWNTPFFDGSCEISLRGWEQVQTQAHVPRLQVEEAPSSPLCFNQHR